MKEGGKLEIRSLRNKSPNIGKWGNRFASQQLASRFLASLVNMSRTIFLLLGGSLGTVAAVAADPSVTLHLSPITTRTDADAETARAFAQEREADVVVLYERSSRLFIKRPERQDSFAAEEAILAHLAALKTPKKLLVVVLGKGHGFADPKQTIDGFWQACKNAGFERVVIQQAHSSRRPILHE